VFKFRLETVLRYRRHVTRQRQQALAERERALQVSNRELQAMLAAQGRARDLLADYRSNPSLPLPEVVVCGDYLRAASQRISRQVAVVDDARERVKERRAELAEALKAQHVVERLRERRRKGYLKEASRQERVWLDEVAGQFRLRSRGEGLIGSGWAGRECQESMD